jgi:fluoride exporter
VPAARSQLKPSPLGLNPVERGRYIGLMRDFLLVGSGGFLGSVSRYYLSGWVLHLTAASRFPYGTLVVNTLGCVAIGALAGAAEYRHFLSPHVRVLVFAGFLGGFTTFSAFGYETYFLGREHSWASAALNVVLHLAIALPAVWVGHRAASLALG